MLFINCVSYEGEDSLEFDFNQTVIDLVKTIEGRKWSATEKAWKIPYSKNYLQKLNEQFQGKLIFTEISETTSKLMERI